MAPSAQRRPGGGTTAFAALADESSGDESENDGDKGQQRSSRGLAGAKSAGATATRGPEPGEDAAATDEDEDEDDDDDGAASGTDSESESSSDDVETFRLDRGISVDRVTEGTSAPSAAATAANAAGAVDGYLPVRRFADLTTRGVSAELISRCRQSAGGAARPTAVQAECWGFLLQSNPSSASSASVGEATASAALAEAVAPQKPLEALDPNDIPVPDTDSDEDLWLNPEQPPRPCRRSTAATEGTDGTQKGTAVVRESADLVAVAPTGSGKTLAFALPLLADGLCEAPAPESVPLPDVLRRFSELFADSFDAKSAGNAAVVERCEKLREAGKDKVLSGFVAQIAERAGSSAASDARSAERRERWRELRSDCETQGLLAPRGLVLTPTRELALQVAQVADAIGAAVEPVVGGVDPDAQRERLCARRPSLLVATPGRLRALCGQQPSSALARLAPGAVPPPAPPAAVALSKVRRLILDEGDRLLDEGFEEDIQALVALAWNRRQSLLFSATWSAELAPLATVLRPGALRVTVAGVAPTILQDVELVPRVARGRRLREVLREIRSEAGKILVFVLYKKEAKELARMLEAEGHHAWALQGNMSQSARCVALQNFRDMDTGILVATDIAARGLDVRGVTHVVNFSLGLSMDSYVHRIGRCGRAGRKGHAVTFVTDGDERHAAALAQLLRSSRQQVPPGLDQMAASYAKNGAGGVALKWGAGGGGEVKIAAKDPAAASAPGANGGYPAGGDRAAPRRGKAGGGGKGGGGGGGRRR
eukprot:TRINITY_DN12696_c1_g1_i1.p1 TRINITY_DN12696_c1_g1~~TRINITY_DN12696_c1_g1_i1.p1  ORF type:complete len:788 (+),score=184.43 TRINITY_DN12696_c1_g1_i1:53-2365(+)